MDVGLTLRADHPGYSLTDAVELAQHAETNGFHSVWRGETSGLDAFLVLGHLATQTEEIKLGTGIVNVYSRTPPLLAMSAATLQQISDGRAILGLGASTETMIQGLHGLPYDQPLRRLRETIEIVEQIFRDGRVEYDGEVDFGPYPLAFENIDRPPMHVAANAPKSQQLTAEYADGWIPVLQPKSRLDTLIAMILDAADAAGRERSDISISPFIPTAISEDPEKAEWQIREYIAREMAMGYASHLDQLVYGEAAKRASEHWHDGEKETAIASLPGKMVEDLAICGTPEQAREELVELSRLDIDELVVAPPFEADAADVFQTIELAEW
jgi:alkanesulfonate monooxygenase SsuD/methylene tetrahydromethanopterin reductase-like flavin-dependent oxidoreductase (luciferase family)